MQCFIVQLIVCYILLHILHIRRSTLHFLLWLRLNSLSIINIKFVITQFWHLCWQAHAWPPRANLVHPYTVSIAYHYLFVVNLFLFVTFNATRLNLEHYHLFLILLPTDLLRFHAVLPHHGFTTKLSSDLFHVSGSLVRALYLLNHYSKFK